MAQRARPSQGAGRGATRKPVTIDLEANSDDEAEKTAPKASQGAQHGAEPVAMDKGGASPAKAQDKTEDKASGTRDAGADQGKNDAPKESKLKESKLKESKTEAPKKAAAPPPPPAKRGGIGTIAAGLIGGVVALLGGYALQWVGVLPSPGSQAETVDLGPVESQISALQARIDELAAAQPAAAEIPQELTQQIDAAVQGTDAAQASIEGLSTQISALRDAISSGEAGEGAGLEALSGRLDGIEQQVASLGDQAASGGGAALDDAAAAIDALRVDLDDLSVKFVAAAQDTDQLRDDIGNRLGALESGLDEARQQLAEGGADSTVVARAIAAAGLKSAIDRGSSFMTELEAYATVAGEDETVTSLRDFAASGVPTVTQLAEGFGAVANRIVATGDGLDENASIGDRLLSSARGLVQVRPVGEVEGDTPGAIAARIETRLKAGNLAAARTEWEALPEAAKGASSAFMDQVQARQTVDQLVAGALSTAMSAAQPAASQ